MQRLTDLVDLGDEVGAEVSVAHLQDDIDAVEVQVGSEVLEGVIHGLVPVLYLHRGPTLDPFLALAPQG